MTPYKAFTIVRRHQKHRLRGLDSTALLAPGYENRLTLAIDTLLATVAPHIPQTQRLRPEAVKNKPIEK